MSMTLYVGNVSYDATENQLQDLFAQYGSVTDVNLMVDRVTQKPRGFAFVTFADKQAGDAAIAGLNGKDFQGRKLKINEARPREERPPRPGGGGGGGGGRGGPRE